MDTPECCLNFCMVADEKINELTQELDNSSFSMTNFKIKEKIDLINEMQEDMKDLTPSCDCEEVRSRHLNILINN